MTKRRFLSRSKKPSGASSVHIPWKPILWICLAGMLIGALILGVWSLYLDKVVREKFEGKKWSLPARVYSRPLELYEGLPLTPVLFEKELEALGYRTSASITSSGQMTRRAASSSEVTYDIYTRGFNFWDKREEPQRFTVRIDEGKVASLMDEKGVGLPLVRMEPEEIGGIYPNNIEDRVLVKLDQLPPLLGETLLAVEDKHFLEHHGVSPEAILRAIWVNAREGEVVQGGSTLTQQLVKNFYLTSEQSLTRKIPEAIMSVLLELHYSKSEILETYINEVYLGRSGSREIHGFGLAAQHYFRQPLHELNAQEIALLVGLVKGASFYNPWRNPERAKNRRNLVLSVMHQENLIDDKQFKIAQASPLGLAAETDVSLINYPAFVDLVKRQLKQDYQEDDLRKEGLRIFTTIAPMVQRLAEKAAATRVAQLEKQYKLKDMQVSMVVTSVGSGEILALIGDKNPRFPGLNRALDAHRQIGSLMKPFVYLTALDQPQTYNLGTLISDDPVSIKGGDGKMWEPKNADNLSHGNMPLYRALAHSENQATVRLGMQLGVKSVVQTVKAAGYNGEIPQVPSILIGAVDMSPMEVTGIYHTLAAEGVYTPLHAIREVLNAEGQPLKRYPIELDQRFSGQSTFELQYALQAVLREGTGRSVYNSFPASLPLAGKTGTTNDQRDSWFAGFSGEHLAVVWVGKDDNSKTPLSGASGALQVWADLMRQLPTQGVNQQPPEGVSYDWIDTSTGLLSAEHCEGAMWLPLHNDFKPKESAECKIKAGAEEHWWQKIFN
ncbi:penicillin-binding protein 1B [Cellvibrio zantedeschiae]|uniref:Penicillin-binding protein 1B n=1 Tax=Cellvibrio zantedeschiae TaxID=1237077 RepID=A0ABQ3B661_9GAMM|nr:penicillin-binding protein 1B [Cellvibrio zantedeschiae]GGY79988.1 penicillin-binding protein 1B [Cellvibrio zantedeschiae]